MKKHLLYLAFLFSTVEANAQLFSQNFNSSTNLADYSSATPNNGQFDGILTTNSSSATASIYNNSLRLARTVNTSGTVRAARITDLSTPAPTFIAMKFDLTVSGNTTSKLSAASVYVGSAFTTNASADASVNARLGINLSATNGNFSLRKFKPGASSSSDFVGTQTITYVINNSGIAKTYVSPSGSSESIADKTSDVWIGTTKVFDDTPEEGDFAISDFKIIFDGGSASPFGIANLDFDNIVISDLSTLPITLSQFTGKANAQTIDLSWKTAAEQNNSMFEITRSGDDKVFQKIGTIKGAGTTNNENTYHYSDKTPPQGINYYQLKQIDIDGKWTLSEVLPVKTNSLNNAYNILWNNEKTELTLMVQAPHNTAATFAVYDLNGRKLSFSNLNLKKGPNNFTIQINSGLGLHIADLEINNQHFKKKLIK